ncbi:alpha/beta fold hydrolase [Candidatus Enterococcus murrayae]|uniref:Alpha/beta fold hydrolase n=1 Tax=Candidatus Enterococcus murrayae TaxID=2815321 RepID=A0ABS3HN52_9ENTE|nr:alpha/beta fold hydrolase [Enterococcus sp. MJM16]MBO0454427.1 alpha/beta fold hydrolase [Enterococcus sp. MJM16]
MKKIILSLFFMTAIFALIGCGSGESKQTEKTEKSPAAATSKEKNALTKSAVPTVFIHGYGGTVNSFGGMIQRFSNEWKTKKEMLITVQADGTLTVDGQLSKEKSNPSVQVLFAANKDNEWNQTEWIYTVLKYLKQQGVAQVNLVGHSMGGVSSLRYLTTYGQPSDASKINKFISIGAPFNDFTESSESIEDVLKSGRETKASRYVDYENGISNVPNDLPIFLVAGKLDEKTDSDGTVPLNSALATYSLLKDHGNPISYQIFTGSNAQHSQLHENTGVDQAIANFLWK